MRSMREKGSRQFGGQERLLDVRRLLANIAEGMGGVFDLFGVTRPPTETPTFSDSLGRVLRRIGEQQTRRGLGSSLRDSKKSE
jgi:hypothetical protein